MIRVVPRTILKLEALLGGSARERSKESFWRSGLLSWYRGAAARSWGRAWISRKLAARWLSWSIMLTKTRRTSSWLIWTTRATEYTYQHTWLARETGRSLEMPLMTGKVWWSKALWKSNLIHLNQKRASPGFLTSSGTLACTISTLRSSIWMKLRTSINNFHSSKTRARHLSSPGFSLFHVKMKQPAQAA